MRPFATLAFVCCIGCGGYPAAVAREAASESWRAPADFIVPTSAGAGAMHALERTARRIGVSVNYRTDLLATQGLFGLTIDRNVWIDSTVPVDAQLDSLAHELGHVLEPFDLSHAESEVFAELVATTYCRRVGVDTRHQSARYLADYRQALRIERVYRSEIRWAVDVLIGR